MKKEIKNFYDSAPENYKEMINKLSSTILQANNQLTQDIKWNRLTFALNEDYHHWICSIGITKKAIALYFHFGGLLEDKYKILISGESKFLRKIEYKTLEDINDKFIKDYILQAISKLDYFKENWKKLI